jgi:hypothetical protein
MAAPALTSLAQQYRAVLAPRDPSYVTPNPKYAFLFNSYYVQAGERHCRARRGPGDASTVEELFAYRRHVDDAMLRLLHNVEHDPTGLHHEQQHQELVLADIEHVFWMTRCGRRTRRGPHF